MFRSVSYTGLYHNKHRRQKLRAQKHQIAQIFRDAANSGLAVPALIMAELEQQQNARIELLVIFDLLKNKLSNFLYNIFSIYLLYMIS